MSDQNLSWCKALPCSGRKGLTPVTTFSLVTYRKCSREASPLRKSSIKLAGCRSTLRRFTSGTPLAHIGTCHGKNFAGCSSRTGDGIKSSRNRRAVTEKVWGHRPVDGYENCLGRVGSGLCRARAAGRRPASTISAQENRGELVQGERRFVAASPTRRASPVDRRYWIELAAFEKTEFDLEPIKRTVPTTMTRITASITAYSAISWPCSSFHN